MISGRAGKKLAAQAAWARREADRHNYERAQRLHEAALGKEPAPEKTFTGPNRHPKKSRPGTPPLPRTLRVAISRYARCQRKARRRALRARGFTVGFKR